MQEEIIHSLTRWIDQNLDKTLSIDEVAARSGYSKWHLQRMFRTVTKQTLGGYIRERRLTLAAEALRQTQNAASDAIAKAVQDKATSTLAQQKETLRALKADIKTAEAEQLASTQAFESLMLGLPNLPDDAVPDGRDENDNRLERTVGAPGHFDFTPQDHTTLGEGLGILNFADAAKISGARFSVLRGLGAKLERALSALMLDMAQEHGYEEVSVPLLVKPQSMQAAGQYPKFIGESFETQDRELVLIPTSEVPLVNLYRDSIVPEAELPVRLTAHTPCFRREAGSAGKDTRGLIRLHQFNKVEMVSLTTPEASQAEHERITGHAEAVLQRLGLPYRVVTLCTGDLGFAATKTYDLEVWLPGSNKYREISSVSNCGAFQARRGSMRYRSADGKIQPLHTLNGSGIAVGRALVAVLENYQQADGSVVVPEALRAYMGGVEKIAR